MVQVELGLDAANRAKAAESKLMEEYKKYNPKVRDITRYLKNIYVDNNGRKEYKPLIGDAPTAITTFISFVIGKTPVLLRSFSGSGKTVIMNSVLSLLPESDYKEIDAGSGVAIWNQVDEINQYRYLVFPELQKSASNPEVNEVLKSLGEFKSATRGVTDITQGGATQDRVVERTIQWKPFLTSVAVENERGVKIFDAELNRRMIDVYTDISEDATAKVIETQLQTFEQGVTSMLTMTDAEIDMLKFHVKQVIIFTEQHVKEYRFPGATAIKGQIPAKFVQSRSATPLLIRVMCAFAAFNYKNRIITEEGVLLVAPEDVYLAWQCYGPRFLQKCMNMDIMAEEMLSVFPKSAKASMVGRQDCLNEHELRQKLQAAKINVSKKKLKELLESFVDSGILDTWSDPEFEKEVCYYRTGIDDIDGNIHYNNMIEQCRKVVTEQYPKYADEYIKEYCNKTVVPHPFSAESVNLITGERTAEAE